jgi:hypothetical protein
MVVLAALVLAQGAPVFVHEPLSSYKQTARQGFKVYVSSAAQKQPSETDPALELLNEELAEVVRLVPPKALPTLRKVPFFVEYNNPGFPCASYHPSKEWLLENGYIIAKTHAIEISNPKNFVSWVNLNQPLMVLHELAHAYHDAMFTFEDKYIAACYRLALVSGTYDVVAHNRGGTRRHYALNNPMEYFAEATEAYFGENDFYPFNREQLKKHDPKGYEMIERCWGLSPKRRNEEPRSRRVLPEPAGQTSKRRSACINGV